MNIVKFVEKKRITRYLFNKKKYITDEQKSKNQTTHKTVHKSVKSLKTE